MPRLGAVQRVKDAKKRALKKIVDRGSKVENSLKEMLSKEAGKDEKVVPDKK